LPNNGGYKSRRPQREQNLEKQDGESATCRHNFIVKLQEVHNSSCIIGTDTKFYLLKDNIQA